MADDDQTGGAGNAEAQLLAEREREELEAAFRRMLKLDDGKRVLFWLLEQCAIYEDPFAGELTSATNHALGRQDVGRRMIRYLDQLDPRMYPDLLIERANIKVMDLVAIKRANEVEDDENEA